jgi:phage terminase large subunit
VSNAIQTVALFAANASRRKLRVFVDENNNDTCYAHTTAGTNRIANLQPGGVYNFDGIYGLDIERAVASGGNCLFYFFEEA